MTKGQAPLETRFNQSIELHHKEGRNIINPHNEKNLQPLPPWEHGEYTRIGIMQDLDHSKK